MPREPEAPSTCYEVPQDIAAELHAANAKRIATTGGFNGGEIQLWMTPSGPLLVWLTPRSHRCIVPAICLAAH
jgi:hypothetical protein